MEKLNKEKLIFVKRLAHKIRYGDDTIRSGQAFMMALEGLFPEVAEDVRRVKFCDPTWNDGAVDKCIYFITNG